MNEDEVTQPQIPEVEPIKSKIAYQDYLMLGPGRSVQMLYAKYMNAVDGTSLKPYASLKNLQHWHRAHQWDERVLKEIGSLPVDQAAELDKLDLLRKEREVKLKQIEEWGQFQEEHRSKMANVGERLLERAMEMLDAPLYRDEIEEDGMTVVRIPVKWGPADAARYIDLADRVTRLAAEMDTARTRLTVDKARVKELADKFGLPVDEIMRRAEEIVKGDS